ncbi:MAG: hypothetical protein AB7P69_20645 [Candidatus Binatia bacterium]
MGLAIHAAARAAELNPQARLFNQLANSLARLVRKFEEQEHFSLKKDQLLWQVFSFALVAGAVAVGGPAVALPAGAFALGANKVLKAARLELNVRDEHVKTLELPPNRAGVLGALNNIIEDVQEKAKKPLLVIIDGLDKVSFARARLLFVDSALLAEPTCALVYSAPIEFAHRPEGGQMLNFFSQHTTLRNPSVQKKPLTEKNWKAKRESNDDGIAVMQKILVKRLAAHGKSTDDIITPDAAHLLARTSGGIIREFVRYLHDAATFAQLRETFHIDMEIAQNAVNQQRQVKELQLGTLHREVLRAVLQKGQLSGKQSDMEVEEILLRSLSLLSYQDDHADAWFDAHPNVLPLL